MTNHIKGESLEPGEALGLCLAGTSEALKSKVGRKLGEEILWLDCISVQNVEAEGDTELDQYLALGVIMRTVKGAHKPPVRGYLRIDQSNDWGLSDTHLTKVGACALDRPLRYGHPDGEILTAPEPMEAIDAAIMELVPEANGGPISEPVVAEAA